MRNRDVIAPASSKMNAAAGTTISIKHGRSIGITRVHDESPQW